MVVSLAGRAPVAANEQELPALAQLARFLQSCEACDLRLAGPDGEVALPSTAVGLLRQVAEALARDDAVAIVPLRQRLNTYQAAVLLTVPHEDLLRLLDEGTLPSEAGDTDRYVRFDQLMAYREQEDVKRRAGLVELIRLSEELGLYDDDPPAPPRSLGEEHGEPPAGDRPDRG